MELLCNYDANESTNQRKKQKIIPNVYDYLYSIGFITVYMLRYK